VKVVGVEHALVAVGSDQEHPGGAARAAARQAEGWGHAALAADAHLRRLPQDAMGSRGTPQLEDVAESMGSDERRSRAFVLEQGVGDDGRGVGEK
jgi:hypothetical protein